MFSGKKILALIPARGGSKGIPGKNIIALMGKPLIAWTIEAALKSAFIDRVIVSTDSTQIAEVSRKFGADVPFMRPAELAQDKSKTIDAIIHAIEKLNASGNIYDVLILLQPTSPLRTSEDIDGALKTFFANNNKSLVSISPVEDNPLLIRTLNPDKITMNRLLDTSSTCRRQDMPEYYRVNGSIYINLIREININTSFNDNIIPFVMSKDHSVDIDEPADLAKAEYYIVKLYKS